VKRVLKLVREQGPIRAAEVGGPRREAAGVVDLDLAGPVHPGIGQDRRRRGVLDAGHPADHGGRIAGQLGFLPLQGLAVGHGEQVGAELVDLGQQR